MPKNQNTTKVRGWAGLVNTHSPEELSGADRTKFPVLKADNVYLTNARRLKSRPGFALSSSGDYHSLWSSGDQVFVGKGTTLQSVARDLTETQLQTGLQPRSRISYAVAGDRVFYMNEVGQRGSIRDGSHLPWGLPISPPPSLATTNGALDAGEYQVSVTQRTADGAESGVYQYAQITVAANQGILVTMPSSAADASTYVVYCSTVNSKELYEVAEVSTGTSTVTISNTGNHGRLLVTQDVIAPPLGSFIAYHSGRMYVAMGQYLYYSDAMAYGWFRENQFFAFPEDVRLVAPVKGGMFVCADRTYYLSGDDPNAMNQDVVSDAVAVKGTLEYLEPGDIPDIQTAQAVWMSDRGFVLGAPGGGVTLLTEEQFTFAVAAEGSLDLVKQDGVMTLVGLMPSPSDSDDNFGMSDRVSAEIVRNTVV